MNRWSAVLLVAGAAAVAVVTVSSCNTQCSPACPNGYTCNAGTCSPKTCSPACGAGMQCQLGTCVAIPPDAGPQLPSISSSCTPKLVNGGQLGPTSRPPCTRKVSAPAPEIPANQVQAFGTKPVGTVIDFDVPPGTESVTIMQQAVSSADTINYQGDVIGNSAVPDLVTSPTQGLLFNDNPAPDAGASPFPEQQLLYYLPGERDTNTMTIPNTSLMLAASANGLPSGTWSFTVSDYARECLTIDGCDGGTDGGQYDVSVITKPVVSSSTRTVDVSVILVAAGIDATHAVSDPHVARFADMLGAIYLQAGICPGTVTFFDAPQWAQAAYASGIDIDDTSECGDLPQLTTIATNGNTLNLFMFSDLVETSGGTKYQTVGLDGTIPGPSGFPGTVNSGAAVSASDLFTGTCPNPQLDLSSRCGPDHVAYIAAHEGGHWLGLYHPSEKYGTASDGTFSDPLTDTPICSCLQCSGTGASNCLEKTGNLDTATVMTPAECSSSSICGGADNLMYWLAGPGSIGHLTAQQADVMKRNLLAH